MIKFENECVGCPPNMGCLGGACPYRSVPHWICDRCDAEVDDGELWNVDGEELCEECLKENFPRVTYDDHNDDGYEDVYDRADYEYDRWKDKEYEDG